MSEKKIGIAILGTGGRSQSVVENLLKDSNGNAVIKAVYDPDNAEMDYALNRWQVKDAKKCASYAEAIAEPGVEWVMVFSPNVFHKEQILAAFAANKHVFTEKPLATEIEACQEIYEAHQKSNVLFATGFVLRYAPIYRRAKEILKSGKLGKLLLIEGNENITPQHGGYIMCNWRRDSKISGPHILEKCCHDLDLINWYVESLPSKVASFGGREFFIPENRNLEDKYGKKAFCTWRDPHATETPFTNDSDMMDTQVAIAEYRNRIRVTFTATMSNAMPERRLVFHCTEGTMFVELYKMELKYSVIGSDEVHTVNFPTDGHAGGDQVIMKEIYDSMANGTAPVCGGNEGLESAVLALALDQAAQTGTLVDLEPVWKKLGR